MSTRKRKYDIPFELLVEANNVGRSVPEKLRYVIERIGCSYLTLYSRLKKMGYVWSPIPASRANPAVFKKFREKSCAICGENRIVELAHKISRADGGLAIASNLVPLCPTHHSLFDRGLLSQDESTELEYAMSFNNYLEAEI